MIDYGGGDDGGGGNGATVAFDAINEENSVSMTMTTDDGNEMRNSKYVR